MTMSHRHFRSTCTRSTPSRLPRWARGAWKPRRSLIPWFCTTCRRASGRSSAEVDGPTPHRVKSLLDSPAVTVLARRLTASLGFSVSPRSVVALPQDPRLTLKKPPPPGLVTPRKQTPAQLTPSSFCRLDGVPRVLHAFP